jgi:hypothetical protein
VRADVNFDRAFRGVYGSTGAPAEWLEDEDKAAAVKAQARAEQTTGQEAAALGHADEQAGKTAMAVKHVGDMATSLRNAGFS